MTQKERIEQLTYIFMDALNNFIFDRYPETKNIRFELHTERHAIISNRILLIEGKYPVFTEAEQVVIAYAQRCFLKLDSTDDFKRTFLKQLSKYGETYFVIYL